MVYRFTRGERVEISNHEEGLFGSYYPANIISYLSDDEYIVQYKTLLEDDGSALLREIVSVDQIRPMPPPILATDFSLSNVIDALDYDGWWIGKIKKKIGSGYLVHFELTREKKVYPLHLLRIHQEWEDGVWVNPKN